MAGCVHATTRVIIVTHWLSDTQATGWTGQLAWKTMGRLSPGATRGILSVTYEATGLSDGFPTC